MAILLLLLAHSALSVFGVPYGWWVAREARLDAEFIGANATTSDQITARLRRRNTFGIYLSHLLYFFGAIATWGLLALYYVDVVGPRWAFAFMVLIGSLRSIGVQVILLWLSYRSRADRLALRKLDV